MFNPRPSKFIALMALVGLFSALPILAQAPAAETAEAPKADPEKMMYAMGVLMSQSLSTYNLNEEEFKDVVKGLQDGFAGNEAATEIDVRTYGLELRKMAQERMMAAQKQAASVERAEGAAFLEKMEAEEGAKKTDSGLIYFELTAGDGASPTVSDRVKVHYHGTLRDGSVFDSSVERGTPATFGLSQVVSCWTEGLQLMKVGGKSKLICPPDIAYGDRATGKIKPGSTLVFEVELLEIEEVKEATTAPPTPGQG